jgi:hypothetical protein
MIQPDPTHQANLNAVLKLTTQEIRRRLDIEDYRDSDYVASEVLVSMIRARFGKSSGLLDRAGAVLYKRLMKLISSYFAKNPNWRPVIDSSSETLKEASSTCWLALLSDTNPVTFAEVRFLPWVEARTLDFLRQQVAHKNQTLSLETMGNKENDGEMVAFANLLEDDEEDEPEAVFDRQQLEARLNAKWWSLEPLARKAVYYRLECEYEWKKVAEFLKCSVPTARKHYKTGLKQLEGAIE